MVTLADAIGGKSRIIGGPFGSRLTQRDYCQVGIPVVRGSNMGGEGRWIGGSFVYVSEEKFYKDLSGNSAVPGSIVVTQRGTLGQVSIIPEKSSFNNYVISQSQMAIDVDPSEADRDFVYYYLISPSVRDYIETNTIQTGVPHINLGLLRDMPVDWPPLDEQRAIACVLGALDDKIELNRRMNETLEAMARAIFRDWFVDFGPTRAKMEGRAPYLAPEIWSLFPDRLDADGKPEGWQILPVSEVAKIRGGQQLNKNKFIDDGPVPVFGGAGLMGYTDHHNAEGFVISVGRVGAYCGQFFAHRGKAWINNNASLISPKEGISGEWLFLALRELDINVIKKGAAQPFVSNSDLLSMQTIWPSEPVMEAMDNIVGPLQSRQDANHQESQTLIEIRDLLLPKLMSGEIRISDAEQILEGA